MKKVSRKLPQSVKVKRRVNAAVTEALQKQVLEHQDNFLCIEKSNSTEQLKEQLIQSKSESLILPVLQVKQKASYLVNNWKDCWKWFSTWAFILIGYIAINGVPQEILTLLPEVTQTKVIAICSALGFIFRFINQSRSKE